MVQTKPPSKFPSLHAVNDHHNCSICDSKPIYTRRSIKTILSEHLNIGVDNTTARTYPRRQNIQTRLPGSPLQTTINIQKIQLTPCRTTTNRNLKQTMGTIGWTAMTTTKTTASLTTTPKTSIDLPKPITIPPNTMLDTSERKSRVPVIPALIHEVPSVKM